MRKFFLILFLQTILVLGIFPYNFSKAWADDSCKNLTVDPSATSDKKFLNVTFETYFTSDPKAPYGLKLGDKIVRNASVTLDAKGIPPIRIEENPAYFSLKGSSPFTIAVSNLAENGVTYSIANDQVAGLLNLGSFKPRTYIISVWDREYKTKFCETNLDITRPGTSPDTTTPGGGTGTTGVCLINFTNDSWTPNDDIKIKVDNLGGNPDDRHRIIIRRDSSKGQNVDNWCELESSLEKDEGVNIKKHESGKYYLEIANSCQIIFGWDEHFSCARAFTVTTTGEGGGPGEIIQPSVTLAPLAPPCSEWKDQNGNTINPPDPAQENQKAGVKCAAVETALGKFKTEPQGFISSLMGLILSLSGGIALLLIIISGYKLMTSQGNPEKVQGAKETLTSAIVGLVFVIFSFLIIQLIGVDILRIPGFLP